MKPLLLPNRQRSPVLIFTCLLMLLVASLATGQWPDYGQLAATLDQPLSRLRWIVGDISEVTFYKHELPALGLLLGACLAHWPIFAGIAGRVLPSAMEADYGHGYSPARYWAFYLATPYGDGPWPVAPGNQRLWPLCHCRQPWCCCLVRAGE